MKRLLPFVFLAVLGCAANSTRGEITAVVWSGEMRSVVTQWQVEVARKYDDAVVVFCHGDDLGGQWVFVPDPQWKVEPVADAIERLRKSPVVGSRRIVLVTCNPGNYALPSRVGRVTFCGAGLVRFSPDKQFIKGPSRSYVGNVYELVEQ